MVDITKLSIQDRINRAYKESPLDSEQTAKRVCVENTAADPVPTTSVPDTSGSTKHFPGFATAAALSVPASPGNVITTAIVVNHEDKKTETLDYSFDGGVTYSTLKPGSFIGFSIKGGLTQVKVKRGSTATADIDFDIILNRVP